MLLYTAILSALSLAGDFEIHGHRGARARFPENTLPAFEYALKVGTEVLELDLAVTKDRVLVVSHDPHVLQKVGTEAPLINALTLKQVKTYDVGAVPNPRFPDQKLIPGTRIPTLGEVFELVKKSRHPAARKVRFNIETKIFPNHPEYTVDPDTFAKLVLESVKKHGMQDRVIIQSFDPRTLKALMKLEPSIPRSILVEDPSRDLVAAGRDVKAEVVSPQWELLTKEKVQALHRHGFQVIPWTANAPEAWDKLVALGVDAIITDDPEGLILHRARGNQK